MLLCYPRLSFEITAGSEEIWDKLAHAARRRLFLPVSEGALGFVLVSVKNAGIFVFILGSISQGPRGCVPAAGGCSEATGSPESRAACPAVPARAPAPGTTGSPRPLGLLWPSGAGRASREPFWMVQDSDVRPME